MYVAGAEHANRGPALAFLAQVRDGSVEATTSTEVLQEILHRYTRLGRPEVAFEVYRLFVELCHDVLPVSLADTDLAVQLLTRHPGVSVRDALHAAVMQHHGLTWIATFDTGFDGFPNIKRLPLAPGA
jgi:predicted nucleic acid-binding protein